jgi:hypothetical protein
MTTQKETTMDIATILSRKYAGSEWTLNGDAYEGLDWLSDTTKPTKSALEKLWPEVQAEIAAEAQAKLDAKASAVAKLEALGLTVEEVSVAFGLEA